MEPGILYQNNLYVQKYLFCFLSTVLDLFRHHNSITYIYHQS